MTKFLALATDYDGTLALDGHVSDEVVASVEQLRATGYKIILVTGRQLPELKAVFRAIGICDLVVAENGALLYWPQTDLEELLGSPPPEEFLTAAARHGVQFALGKVIFATWRPQESVILQILQELGIGYQIIFNKRAVMVLPSNVNKASGLLTALERLGIPAENVVGVGDAENDHPFLEVCGVAVAVDNALPALKERCDLVTLADHGQGVQELIQMLLTDGLKGIAPRSPSVKPVVPQSSH